jgi:chaperone modulatory protein CbpM
MNSDLIPILSGEILEEEVELSLAELCRACRLPAEEMLLLVEEGIVEPVGPGTGGWRFRGVSVRRVLCAVQLHRDLGVNWAGAALALDLLDELQELRARLRRFESE